ARHADPLGGGPLGGRTSYPAKSYCPTSAATIPGRSQRRHRRTPATRVPLSTIDCETASRCGSRAICRTRGAFPPSLSLPPVVPQLSEQIWLNAILPCFWPSLETRNLCLHCQSRL